MKLFQLRFVRIALIVIGVLFVAIQFVRPARNESANDALHLSKTLPLPDSVEKILKTSCYDCHSNTTTYPWYFSVQPVAWWMDDHIEEAKHDLNFSEFSGYSAARKFFKLKGVDTTIQRDFMPLNSYLWIHHNARLDDHQKAVIHRWVEDLCDTLRHQYPPDSLKRPVRQRRQAD